MPLTLATFNVENLFNRYASLDQPWENRSYDKYVQAILDSQPDFIAIQEIENLYTLRIISVSD